MKIRPVGAELFHGEVRKDERADGHDEVTSRFSPKNVLQIICQINNKSLHVETLELNFQLHIFGFPPNLWRHQKLQFTQQKGVLDYSKAKHGI